MLWPPISNRQTLSIKMTNIGNNPAPALPLNWMSPEQLVVMLESKNNELRKRVKIMERAMQLAYESHHARMAELYAEQDKMKESMNQLIKKDEMKTALLKQLMKK
jgi:hypothetical protein